MIFNSNLIYNEIIEESVMRKKLETAHTNLNLQIPELGTYTKSSSKTTNYGIIVMKMG